MLELLIQFLSGPNLQCAGWIGKPNFWEVKKSIIIIIKIYTVVFYKKIRDFFVFEPLSIVSVYSPP
jgi:hypothetical protein